MDLQEFSTQDCCNLEHRLDLRTTMVVRLPICWDQKLGRLVVHGLNGRHTMPCYHCYFDPKEYQPAIPMLFQTFPEKKKKKR